MVQRTSGNATDVRTVALHGSILKVWIRSYRSIHFIHRHLKNYR